MKINYGIQFFYLIFLFGILSIDTRMVKAQTAVEYYFIASDMRLAGNFEKAITYFDEAIARNPKLKEALAERGYCKSRLKLYQEALADFNQAINLGLQDPLVYLNRGWTYYNLGRKKEACLDWIMTEQLGYHKVKITLEKYCQ